MMRHTNQRHDKYENNGRLTSISQVHEHEKYRLLTVYECILYVALTCSLLLDLRITIVAPMQMFYDNQPTIYIANAQQSCTS